MTAKQILDGMMLSYFRHLVDSDHTPSEAIDAMVGKLLVPTPEPTITEVRWLNAVKARLKAELTVDKPDGEDKKETPLFDNVPDAMMDQNMPRSAMAATSPKKTTFTK